MLGSIKDNAIVFTFKKNLKGLQILLVVKQNLKHFTLLNNHNAPFLFAIIINFEINKQK